MKNWILLLFITVISISAECQNLVGLKSTEIKEYMKKNKRELSPENVINSKYSYLKYTNIGNTQTILFFLNNDSVCRSMRMIYDLTLKKETINELNTHYFKSGEDKWIDNKNGKEFTVTIEPSITN
jgi:hypothetical protein